jgi:hypothetical protein
LQRSTENNGRKREQQALPCMERYRIIYKSPFSI